MNKLRTLFLLIFIFLSTQNFSQTISKSISKKYFGQNAWMPDTIGNVNQCQEPPCILYGKLHKMWGDIKASGSGVIRFGGIAPDRNMPTNYQYLKMIDAVRANGMEPVIQVPFHMNRYTAAQAAEIVKFINITNNRAVKYFIIGNEPNLEYKYTEANQVTTYIKEFATAMKLVDPTILIVGPELAWYDSRILNDLTNPGSSNITGLDANGHYFLDILTFHTYPFNGTQTRSDVITKLMAVNGFNDNLIDINKHIGIANSYHNRLAPYALRAAVTEANIDYINSPTDDLYGVGANSFIGGQFWAELLAIGMKNHLEFVNLWSVSEGGDNAGDIGFIDKSSNKKPTYYHFKMMAENFRGVYCSGTDNVSNVKAFGSKIDNQIVVMIMNQDQATNFKYTVRLNTGTIIAPNALDINIDANVSKEFTDNIENQSTTLLIFDGLGNIVKKEEYKLSAQAVAHLPPSIILYASGPGLVTTVANMSNDFDMKVSPNPSNGSINIKIKNTNTTEAKINIFNIMGQLVSTVTPKMINFDIDEHIDLNGLISNGLYIIQIKLGNKTYNNKILFIK
jgi:hypothetical protein